MARMTEVVALEMGHDGRSIRNAGERFHVDLDDKRFDGVKWFVPVDKAPPPKPAPKRPPGAGPAKGSAARDDGTPGAGPSVPSDPAEAADESEF